MLKINLNVILAFSILLEFNANNVEATPVEAASDLTGTSYKVSHEVVIDNIIDKNIDEIREIASRLDPMSIDDSQFKVTSHIYMSLKEGWLQNLSQLRRDGRCTLEYSDTILSVDLNFAWDELAFDYRYLVKALLYSREGDLHGQLYDLKINVGLDIDLKNYKIILKKFDFVHAGKVSMRLEGHKLDAILNLAMKAATTFCKTLILQVINCKGIDMIQSDIRIINEQLADIVNPQQLFTFVDLIFSNTSFNVVQV